MKTFKQVEFCTDSIRIVFKAAPDRVQSIVEFMLTQSAEASREYKSAEETKPSAE